MTIRSLFLTVSLFLSVGIAFGAAEEPVDEDTRRETTYFLGNVAEAKAPLFQFFSEFQNTDAAKSESSWAYDTAGDESDEATNLNGDLTAAPASQSIAGKESAETGTAALAASRASDNASFFHAYDFSVPFSDSILEKNGFWGHIDDDNQPVSATPLASESADMQRINALFFFDKKAFSNDLIDARIMSERSNIDDLLKKEETFSSPLSTPFSMLFILIGFGIILVIYTAPMNGNGTGNE